MTQKLFRISLGILLLAATMWTADQFALSPPAASAQTDYACASEAQPPECQTSTVTGTGVTIGTTSNAISQSHYLPLFVQ